MDLGSGYAWWLQGQHGLEVVLQLPYGRRHDEERTRGTVPCVGKAKVILASEKGDV